MKSSDRLRSSIAARSAPVSESLVAVNSKWTIWHANRLHQVVSDPAEAFPRVPRPHRLPLRWAPPMIQLATFPHEFHRRLAGKGIGNEPCRVLPDTSDE